MNTFRRVLLSDHFLNHVRNSICFSTKARHINPRKNRSLINPGINRQAKLLKETSSSAVLEEDVDLEELESDFMDMGISYNQHMEELEARREQQKYFIVGQKYFKEKFPNFLTWNDKQQIKFLHRTDPEQWTIERLSESFPALPEVIARILKTNWTKKNVEKIKRHDESVCHNWEKFKKGELKDLPQDVAAHLRKFTDREFNIDAQNPIYDVDANKKVLYKQKTLKTEFCDIITSYEKLTTKHAENVNPPEETKLLENNDVSSTFEQRSRKRVTLPQLKKDIETAVQTGKHVSETDLYILKEVKTEDERHEVMELQEDLSAIQHRHEKPNKVSATKKKDYSFLEYPLHIRIPRKVHKPGCVYKLNDCYYDDDGQFLYRVPGMGS